MIGGESPALPPAVNVTYRGVPVVRLTKTTVVVWNAGTTTIRGSDIVAADPLRVAFREGGQVLDAEVTQVRRRVNSIAVQIPPGAPNTILVTFDFLDPKDGARIEILHTSEDRTATILGTVRGIPDGCADWGTLPPSARLGTSTRADPLARTMNLIVRRPRLMFGGMALIGGLAVVVGLFPDLVLSTFPRLGEPNPRPFLETGRLNWPFLGAGLFYMLPALWVLWATRRRFPKQLEGD